MHLGLEAFLAFLGYASIAPSFQRKLEQQETTQKKTIWAQSQFPWLKTRVFHSLPGRAGQMRGYPSLLPKT